MEFCAAVLGTRLTKRLISIFGLESSSVFLWLDSIIMLNWINRPPREFKQFVAARLSEIQQDTQTSNWFYTPSKSKPADLITGRSKPKELSNNEVWWHGPFWLTLPQTQWPIQPTYVSSNTIELRRHVEKLINDLNEHILCKYNSYLKTIRVLSYVLMFTSSCKVKCIHSRKLGPLSPDELEASFLVAAKIIQI